MYYKITFALLLFVSTVLSQVKIIDPVEFKATAFAIIVDDQTYERIGETINLYRDAIEDDGLSAYILISNWKDPREIKAELIKLNNKKPPLEGIVLIGDIPIPMIRGAQHMTSAFKLDEARYDWFRSSVPSDRYYDDLDLKFDYFGQDTVNTLCHHFMLRADSPQKIDRDFYSGRIKPAVTDESKYDLIKKYLKKAIENKRKQNVLDNMLVFTGHGYYSEALDAWTDEHISLREQFPQLFIPGNDLQFLNFRMSRNMKNILMDELSKPKLDFAIFHAHGADEIQYILNYPEASMINENVESIKMFLRSKLRSAERRGTDLDKTKNYYKENYNVPDVWFEGAFADSVIKADSIFEHTLDIYSEDLKLYDPNAEIVMFDECFNGSFHESGYIAGDYIFDSGNTVVGIANSVNCLQDKWANKLIGTIGLGLRVGLWHKNLGYLENHIIGDPTFRFQNYIGTDLNKVVVFNGEKEYRQMLASDNVPLRSLAIYKLSQILDKSFDQELLRLYEQDESFVVRLQILNCLAASNGDALQQILAKSIYDPYEFIRRVSATLMGKIGKPEYIPIIIERSFDDPSRRVSFAAKGALDVMDPDTVMKYTKLFVDELPDFYNKERILESRLSSIDRSRKWLNEEIIASLTNDSLSAKKKRNELRTFRNYNFVNGIEPLVEYLKNSENPGELRITAAEALGWFNYNFKRGIIIKACDEILSRENESQEFLNEVLKSRNRLLTGANVPLTP